MTDAPKQVATWRKVVAAILDFVTIFVAGGFLVGALTGNLVDGGFDLQGWPAGLLLALIIAYFVGLGLYGGGTLWQRILDTKGRRLGRG